MSATAPIYQARNTIAHWIGGKSIAAADEPTQDVFNPATGEVSHQVALGGAREVGRAVESADAAFSAWADTPSHPSWPRAQSFPGTAERAP